jgi:hypothetical protein
MATIRTSDKRKIEVEIGVARAEEEFHKVAGGQIPLASLKRKGSSEMVLVNLNHVVSVEDD